MVSRTTGWRRKMFLKNASSLTRFRAWARSSATPTRGRPRMSTIPAELIARALLDLAARPGMSEDRLYARELHGIPPADLHSALLTHPTAAIDVRTDDKPVPLLALPTAAGTHFVPPL